MFIFCVCICVFVCARECRAKERHLSRLIGGSEERDYGEGR